MADYSSQDRRGREEGLTPLVSVIMPCYNGAQTIVSAIDSALIQHTDVEVIVINDCSTDETRSVLGRYEKDTRVRIVDNDSQLGAAQSRNKGVRLARAPYIAFLDADDLWREDKLARQLEMLERSGAVLCCTARELMDSEGKRTGRTIGVKEKITYRDELRTNSINCSSVLLRTKTALAYPMQHEDAHEDYITWLKMLRECGDACGIDEPMLIYRLSARGKSGAKYKSARMTFRSYRYAGLGLVRSTLCFISYAFHGAAKYAFSRVRRQQQSG